MNSLRLPFITALVLGFLTACGDETEDSTPPGTMTPTGSGGEGGGSSTTGDSSTGGDRGDSATKGAELGASCVLAGEELTAFSGTSRSEINLEVSSPSCASEMCLSHHFQGRVTCPYGQDESTAQSNEPHCTTPSGAAVVSAVAPQLLERRADRHVICSCRCDGPDEDADYCACPSGMICEPLVEDLGLGKGSLAGSYCIWEGTGNEPHSGSGEVCERELMNCAAN